MIKRMRSIDTSAAFAVACVLLSSAGAHARVTGFDVQQTLDPVFDGRSFGAVGQYQRLAATARFAVKPGDRANAAIVDIDKAPLNERGEVVFTTEVVILQPADATKRNGTIFYEVPNRGRNLSFALINDSPLAPDPIKADDAGNGYLLAQGYTVVMSGWQPDLGNSLLDISVPVAVGTAGLSREEFIFDSNQKVVKAALTYPAADLDPAKATLTVREAERDERKVVPGMAFRYLDAQQIEITRPDGFQAGAIYELIYPAKESKVTGLGFAATRDLLSFLRGSPGHDVASPLTGIGLVLGIGISQSGRFARDLVYQGFNADEGGRQVFDGLMAHIAGSRKTFTNYRFAQPGRYSRQHEDHAYPGDQFPFTYAETQDPLTGRSDGILKSCNVSKTCPKIMHTDTDTEFWQGRASLVVTDPAGRPATIPDNVRVYYLSGTQHFTIAGAKTVADKQCVYDNNFFHVGPVMRALVSGLHAWSRDGTRPPENRFPNRIGTTLVKPEEMALVAMPGMDYRGNVNRLNVMNHDVMPPATGAEYPVYVPATDMGGNVIDGIRIPMISAPLGTHAGWNLRKEGFATGELCSLSGSYLPFARRAAEKDRADARPAIDQLYKSEANYLAAIEASIADLVGDGLVMPDDVPMLREQAAAHWRRTVQ